MQSKHFKVCWDIGVFPGLVKEANRVEKSEIKKKEIVGGASGWLSWLSVQILILTYVMR